ncbi:sushi, nidogen and EGF-like domain-containing protein 1 [Argopecten irradians]|uniref:sushi, nidogen and EGF-like domain-containing protein 1 n=1 Tax=Argopecten irradians TaxID=31199 RepID=UPI00372257E7
MANCKPISLVSLVFATVVSGIILEDMYPYPHNGTAGAEDQLLKRTLDGSSPVINFNFKLFDDHYNTIYVNNNGHLSFFTAYAVYIPQNLPIPLPLIAVFWMDVDTRSTGEVWYRLTNDSDILTRAQTDIANYYDNQTTFQPTKVFIVTWIDVHRLMFDAKCRNTFQIVLMTDGDRSFTMFHYLKIEWAGYANNVTKAIVGFNAGDNNNSYTVNNTDFDDVINLEHRSNTGVPGRFLFSVDGNRIVAAGDEIISDHGQNVHNYQTYRKPSRRSQLQRVSCH